MLFTYHDNKSLGINSLDIFYICSNLSLQNIEFLILLNQIEVTNQEELIL
jgi:hypothetical protein